MEEMTGFEVLARLRAISPQDSGHRDTGHEDYRRADPRGCKSAGRFFVKPLMTNNFSRWFIARSATRTEKKQWPSSEGFGHGGSSSRV